MIKLSQENRQARIDTPLGEDVLLLQHFAGTEALSRGFEYDLTVVSKDAAIDGNAIVGKRISVSYYNDEDGRTRYFNGFVSRFEYAEQVEEPTKMTSYNMTMIPWTWFLKHNKDFQIFQEMPVPDIIKQIFQELGFSDFQLQLTGDYPAREYCVQYNETDFNFVSRLMEEEGIFYYFKHTKDKHTLVLADSPSGYYQLDEAEVRYTPIGQKQHRQLSSWRHVYEFRPGKIAQKDFNFKTPGDGLLTDTKSRVKFEGSSNLEIYEYPGRYEENGNGDRLTQVRLEELEAEHEHIVGSGYYLTFSPGGKFKVEKHSRAADEGKSFALVEVYTELNSNYGFGNAVTVDFQNQFRCIPSDTAFRPQREAVKPIVEGPQTAIVVTDGQEIVVDEHARVKVQFHWDRYGKKDVQSSCWIRVSQVHAGAGWGMIDIPRKDEEVIVSFLDGDPDRPIITGRVYNGQNQPPFGLSGAGNNSKNKKRRGNTTKTYEGSGYNELTMDDTEGEEQIRIHAQYDMDSVIEHNETWHTKNDREKKIDNDETMTIGHDQSLTVKNNKTVTVMNNHTETVVGNQTITVAKNRTVSVGQNETKTVGQAQTTTVGGAFSLNIGSAMTTSVSKKQSTTVSQDQEATVGSNKSTQVAGNQKTVVGKNNELNVSGNSVEKAKEITLSAGTKVTIQAGTKLVLQCGGSSIELTAAGINIKGPLVKINC